MQRHFLNNMYCKMLQGPRFTMTTIQTVMLNKISGAKYLQGAVIHFYFSHNFNKYSTLLWFHLIRF